MPARQNPFVERVMRHLFPKVPDFVALLGDQCRLAVDALEAFLDFTESGDPAAAVRVRALEKDGDRVRQRNLDTLNRAFATTFDRDLTVIAIQRLDDVMNYAKTGVREMEVLSVGPDDTVRAIALELREGAVALGAAVDALRDDAAAVDAHVRVVHKAERNIGKIYRQAITELFPADGRALLGEGPLGDAVAAGFDHLLSSLRRREVYRHLANAGDRLDAAGRAVMDIAAASV